MKTVMEACTPRGSILQGTFNPEVFTAALGPVMQFYRSGSGAIDSIYTDAEAFFREATYPTEGMRQTLSSVFRRIAGALHLPPGDGLWRRRSTRRCTSAAPPCSRRRPSAPASAAG